MIEFVLMEKRHLDGLVKVEEECFNSGYAKNTFEKELENKIAVYFVAEEADEVLGYAGMWNICGSADIMNVGVLKKNRCMGIAQKLLFVIEDYCRRNNVFEINLEVRKSNIPARNLYKKLGYNEIDVRKGYYDGKEDAVIMKKILTGDEK
ncbi:MAG: ribosomal-protein-alanine N-acetyltransferase [Ruminococcaceae bacterium]|nr:ribosomal-protein-alanine N-acetyltransferase [Oscillospiraceae bacterium]